MKHKVRKNEDMEMNVNGWGRKDTYEIGGTSSSVCATQRIHIPDYIRTQVLFAYRSMLLDNQPGRWKDLDQDEVAALVEAAANRFAEYLDGGASDEIPY